jgi:hypothetical protein
MMKKTIIPFAVILIATLAIFTGCVDDRSYRTPAKTLETFELTPNKTVAEIALAAPILPNTITPTSPLPLLYEADDIIEAYVTTTDESGTFYKSISFQDIKAADGTPVGFSVPINETTLFGIGFTPGRKVYIKLKGLYVAKVFGSLQIGSLFEGRIGRISEFDYKNHLFVSATKIDESELVRTINFSSAYNDANQNTLVELDMVQFDDSSLNRFYYDVDSGGGATNHLLSSTTGGTTRIIRFSSFALFATAKKTPSGSGKIRGVLSKFNSDFQFIVRYESDLKLVNPRADLNPPLVGANLNFDSTLNEPFTSYSVNQSTLPKYINDAVVGNRVWQVKNFNSNNYIELSAFNGVGNPGVNSKVYFFVPVNFTTANTFTFKEKVRFYAGSALKVYYVKSDDYIAGGTFNIASFTNITNSMGITYPATGSSENDFNAASIYNIPASLTGNGYFVFEYTGNATQTTTIQIDDVVIN